MAITVIRHAIEPTVAANALTTAPLDTAGANLIVLSISWYGPGAVPDVVSDSLGNTWTPRTAQTTSAGHRCRLYYAAAATGGAAHTFTVHFPASAYFAVGILAVSGAHASPYASENGAVAEASPFATGSVTPPEPGCLVVTGLVAGSAAFASIDSGFTAEDSAEVGGTAVGAAIAYLIQGAAAAVNPTWTWSGGGTGGAAIAAFRPSAGGPLAAGTASLVTSGPAGISASATAPTGGTAPYTYQWQRNADGGAWANIVNGSGVTGATTLALVDGSAVADILYGYRLVQNDAAAGSVTTDPIYAEVYAGGALTGGGGGDCPTAEEIAAEVWATAGPAVSLEDIADAVGVELDGRFDAVDASLAALTTLAAAIKAKTDNLPASPAAVGSNMGTVTSVTGSVGSVVGHTPQTGDSFARIGLTGSGLVSLASQASVNTIDDFLDTEIAAIKAKTDNLPAAPAAVGSNMGTVTSVTGNVVGSVGSVVGSVGSVVGHTPQTGDAFARIGATGSGLTSLASQASVNTIDDFLDTEIAAILAKVNVLPASYPANFPALGINVSGHISRVTFVDAVTSLAALPVMPADWLTAAGVSAGAVTKIQAGIPTAPTAAAIRTEMDTSSTKLALLDVATSTRAPASTALSTAVWTNTKAGYIDASISGVSTGGLSADSIADAVRVEMDSSSTKLANLDAAITTRAPASTALTSAVWTNTKAGYIDSSISGVSTGGLSTGDIADAVRIEMDTASTKLANLDVALSTRADATTALSSAVWTNARANYLDAPVSGITGASAGEIADAVWADAPAGPSLDDFAEAFRDVPLAGAAANSLGAGVTAINTKTANLPATPAAVGSAMVLSPTGLDAVAVETGINARQALALIGAATAGKASGLATTTAIYYAMGPSGTSTARINATVTADGNRTATTLTLPA